MKCVVTGAAGFIGEYLVEALLSEEHSVVAVDRFTHTRPQELFGGASKYLTIVKADILADPSGFAPHIKNSDVLFHLAGKNNTPDAQAEPFLFHANNVTATLQMLELSRQAGVKRFIYAASTSCYGKSNIFPTPETAPIDPQYPYALTKYLGERYTLHWGKVYKMSVVSLRLFSPYGPRKRKGCASGLFLSRFLDAIAEKKPITITGDGTQARDLVYISDVIDVFLAAAKSSVSREVFNVGTGHPVSLKRVIELLGYKKVVYQPRPIGEADKTHADIHKIKKMLNWKPKVSVEEGIGLVLKKDKG